MKILVLSDSHGNISNMLQAVEREQPRAVYHLGDCLRDGERLLSIYHTLNGTKFYIITEADRSATTILLPSEY